MEDALHFTLKTSSRRAFVMPYLILVLIAFQLPIHLDGLFEERNKNQTDLALQPTFDSLASGSKLHADRSKKLLLQKQYLQHEQKLPSDSAR